MVPEHILIALSDRSYAQLHIRVALGHIIGCECATVLHSAIPSSIRRLDLDFGDALHAE
jgi:hypothetical protein